MNYAYEINGTRGRASFMDCAPGAKPLMYIGLKRHLDVEKVLFISMQLFVDGLLLLLDSGMIYF